MRVEVFRERWRVVRVSVRGVRNDMIAEFKSMQGGSSGLRWS